MMIPPFVLVGLGVWCIEKDAVAAGGGCVLWGVLYGLWWWRSRRPGEPHPAGFVRRTLPPVLAAAALVALVLAALELVPSVSPFAPLLAGESILRSSSFSSLLVALPSVLLFGVVVVLMRERRVRGNGS